MANKTPEEIEGALRDASASARSRASVRSNIASNDGLLEQARATLAAAQAAHASAPYDARVHTAHRLSEAVSEVQRREDWARELASKDRLAQIGKLDAAGATKRKAEILAEHAKLKGQLVDGNGVTGPMLAAQYMNGRADELAVLDQLIATPTMAPTPDTDREGAVARDRAHAAELARTNPIAHASFVDSRPWCIETPPEGT